MKTHAIDVPAPRRAAGASESIPRWSWGSRLALGAWTYAMPAAAATLAALAIAFPALAVTSGFLAAGIFFFFSHLILHLLYLSFAAQNPRIRPLWWMLAILVAGPIAIPIYWYAHVWHAPMVGDPSRDDVVPPRRSAEPITRAAIT